MKGVAGIGGACDVGISRERAVPVVPVGEDLAVVVHLDLQHLVLVQPAGNGPPESLEGSREESERKRLKGSVMFDVSVGSR